MDYDQEKTDVGKILGSVDQRNVEMLRRASDALKPWPWINRQIPGTRPDGGMAAVNKSKLHDLVEQILQHESFLMNELSDAHRIVDNFEKSTIELESKASELEAKLSAERERTSWLEDRCAELKNVLQQAAHIMVNGTAKDKDA